MGCKSIEDLYSILGEGQRTVSEIIRVLHPERLVSDKRTKTPEEWSDKKTHTEGKVSLKGLIPGMAVHYAGCCHPLPGDKIVGIVITGRGVTVHTEDCDTLQRYADEPDRWLDVGWSDESSVEDKYVTRLRITIYNKLGSLAALTTLIGKNGGNILNLKITHRTETFFDVIVDVEVTDISHLNNIIGALRSSSHISSVDRAKG